MQQVIAEAMAGRSRICHFLVSPTHTRSGRPVLERGAHLNVNGSRSSSGR